MFSLKYGKTNLLIINIFNNLNSQICVLNLFVEMYAANKTLRIFKKKKLPKKNAIVVVSYKHLLSYSSVTWSD